MFSILTAVKSELEHVPGVPGWDRVGHLATGHTQMQMNPTTCLLKDVNAFLRKPLLLRVGIGDIRLFAYCKSHYFT